MYYRFYNSNAASIRAVMVANCLFPESDTKKDEEKSLNNQPSTSSNIQEERDDSLTSRDSVQEAPEILHHASSRLQLVIYLND